MSVPPSCPHPPSKNTFQQRLELVWLQIPALGVVGPTTRRNGTLCTRQGGGLLAHRHQGEVNPSPVPPLLDIPRAGDGEGWER